MGTSLESHLRRAHSRTSPPSGFGAPARIAVGTSHTAYCSALNPFRRPLERKQRAGPNPCLTARAAPLAYKPATRPAERPLGHGLLRTRGNPPPIGSRPARLNAPKCNQPRLLLGHRNDTAPFELCKGFNRSTLVQSQIPVPKNATAKNGTRVSNATGCPSADEVTSSLLTDARDGNGDQPLGPLKAGPPKLVIRHARSTKSRRIIKPSYLLSVVRGVLLPTI